MDTKFNLDNIPLENRKQLYEKLPNGRRELSIKTQTIISYCAEIIGVPKITEDNYSDVFDRIFVYEEVYGTKAVRWEDIYNESIHKKECVPVYYTVESEDVQKMIGIEIESNESLSEDEWKNKITNMKIDFYKTIKEIEDLVEATKNNKNAIVAKYTDMKTASVVLPGPVDNSSNLTDMLPVKLPDNPALGIIDTPEEKK